MIRLVGKLEDFCCSGEFTTFLSNYADEHAAKFVYETEEQPIQCYTIWQDFKSQVDVKLEEFIAEQAGELTTEEIMAYFADEV